MASLLYSFSDNPEGLSSRIGSDKMREEKRAREEERQKRKGKRAALIAKRERATNELLLAAAAAAEDLIEETANHIPAEDAPAEYFRQEDEA